MLLASGPVQADALSLVGLAVEAVVAAGYVGLARRVGRRHGRWPPASTAAFVTGLLVMVVALQSRLAAYDETPWVHDVQHVLLMSLVPPLLALGAPVTLCLRALPTAAARRLVGVLRHGVARRLLGARHLALGYYGVMVVFLLSPVQALSLHNEMVHVAEHAVFFGCGLLFWVPVAGVDPVANRPARRTRVALVAAGLPVNAVLAAAVGSVALLATAEAATLVGLVLVAAPHRRASRRRPGLRRPVPALAVSAGQP